MNACPEKGSCNLQAMEMIINYKNGIYRLY